MNSILSAIEPYMIEALGLFLTVIISIISRQLYAWTGLEIEKRHREALHEALMSGAMSAIKYGPGEALGTLKAHAIAHARQSTPQAVAALIPGDTVLDRIAERYVRDALNKLGRPAIGE